MARPCEYVTAFRPLWLTLTVFAARPQKITKSGQLVHPVASVRALVTLAAYCVSAWRAWRSLTYHVRFHSAVPSSNVPLRVLNMQFGLYLLSFGILTLFILESGRTARYAQRWHDFQPQLERVCGRPLRNDRLRRSLKYTAAALSVGWPLAVTVPITYAGEESGLDLAETLFLAYCTTVLTLASTSWRMHCAFLLHACTILVDAIDEALQRGSLKPHEVVRLARAWVALREMVHAGAQSIAPTAFLNVVILSMSFTLCTFNIMYNVLNGYSKLGAFLTGVGVLSGATLFRIFNSAHLVGSELSSRAILVLAGTKFGDFAQETRVELDHLRLILVNHPVSMVLFGLLRVNRGVFGGLLAAMATYLVVLVQYAVS